MTTSAVAAMMADGKRLHLQHGPIDLIIGADGPEQASAFRVASTCFATILDDLVAELPLLRHAVGQTRPDGPVARRMHDAVFPHAAAEFVTPMAAVAGAVADELLNAMTAAVRLDRAYVNNGGDIALHLLHGERFRLAMAGLDGTDLGRVTICGTDAPRGVATSGLGGRSLSRGIADTVTVLAATAAAADAAATLIANAVDLPDHPAIRRSPACEVNPDSDLGNRMIVTGCGPLSNAEISDALERGARRAQQMIDTGLIFGSALVLRGQNRLLSFPAHPFSSSQMEQSHA